MFEEQHHTGLCLGRWFGIVLLPTAFVGVLTAGYTGYIPLRIETHTLAIIGAIYLVFLTFARHNAEYAACKVKRGFVTMEKALQEALESNTLHIMGQTKSTLQVRDFMEEYYKAIRNDNFARVAPSVFPMLGILGTFIAIALSMPDFTVKNLDALDREISVLLSGVGTAFYASIYGIFLSLVWIFFEKRGLSRIDTIVHDLERLYDRRIWKKAELIRHEHMQTALRDQEIVKTLKETFNIDFIRDMNEQYLTHFTALVGDTTEQFKRVAHHIQTVSKELRTTLESLQSRHESVDALSQMYKQMDRFNATAQRLEEVISQLNKGVEHTFDTFDEELAKSVAKLGEIAEILAQEQHALHQRIETLERKKPQDDV